MSPSSLALESLSCSTTKHATELQKDNGYWTSTTINHTQHAYIREEFIDCIKKFYVLVPEFAVTCTVKMVDTLPSHVVRLASCMDKPKEPKASSNFVNTPGCCWHTIFTRKFPIPS